MFLICWSRFNCRARVISIRRDDLDIHIVDDDETLRSIYTTFARHLNYRAKAFSGPDEYLEHMGCGEYSPPVLTILSDVEMPKMSGFELMSAVRKVSPDQKFIIFTGGTPSIESKKELACFYFLKPISIGQLEKVFKAISLCVKSGPSTACIECASIDDQRDLFFFKDWHCPLAAN